MNWKDYKFYSEKTLSTEFHCGNKVELLLHAVMGFLTEIEEMLDENITVDQDEVNRMEEFSDATWYLAIIGRELGLELPTTIPQYTDSMDIVMNMTKTALRLLDILKKKIYYNKPIDDVTFLEYSNKVMTLLCQYAVINNIDIERSLDININKLRARYGEKFTSERAINRDLNTERAILENKN